MDNQIKVSVIMPVYCVPKFLGKAIESIQAQTLKEFEFLIVDDGSPDNCGEICDEYAKNDSRLKVIHKENGGAPSARNVAIDIAKGEYMYFMDSDDWAEPTMLEDMYNLAKQNDADEVVAGFYIDTYYSDTEFYTETKACESKVYETQQAFREDAYKLFDNNLLYTPWNKLFRSEYILKNNLRYPQTFWDDFPFNLSVLRDVEKVVVTSKPYYHFMRARAESETAKYRPEMYAKREEEHQWMIDLYKYWGIDDAKSNEMIQRRYIERVIGCIENVTNKQCTLSFSEKMAEIKKMINDPKTVNAVKVAVPHSKMMKIMLIPIKMRSTFLTYLEGTVISRVKSTNTKLFAKLKSTR